MVTARQKALVEASWGKVRPIGLSVAELFYDRLFELDPLLEDMFESELTGQGAPLMRAIGVLVTGLGDLDTTLPIARELGRRNAAYGVRPGHYATFGKAWLWTLEQSLAEDFTPALEEAWAAVHALLSSEMIEAAENTASHERADGAEPESRVHRLSPVARNA
jgi:hemoglobin-like flavoprotein